MPSAKEKNVDKKDEVAESEPGPSRLLSPTPSKDVPQQAEHANETGDEVEEDEEEEGSDEYDDDLADGMDPEGFAGDKTLKPLTAEALAAFKASQERAGVIYISRIPPGMRPAKVRHLMSAYGAVGRVYLQQEDPKRAYLRKKYTSTKKVHYTEGWVEFKDKKIARSVAEMLNAQPIGGKKGNRWRDDIWTMKYLPRFKWNMLTEHIAHEAAVHTAKLRVELAQSKAEQQQYLKNVDLAKVLDKRAAKKKEKGEEFHFETNNDKKRKRFDDDKSHKKKKTESSTTTTTTTTIPIDNVLKSIF